MTTASTTIELPRIEGLRVLYEEPSASQLRDERIDILVDARENENSDLRSLCRAAGARYDRQLGIKLREAARLEFAVRQLRLAIQAERRVCLLLDEAARQVEAPERPTPPPRPDSRPGDRIAVIVEGEWHCPACSSLDVHLRARDARGKTIDCAACGECFLSPDGQCIWCGSLDTYDEMVPMPSVPGQMHEYSARSASRRRCRECVM